MSPKYKGMIWLTKLIVKHMEKYEILKNLAKTTQTFRRNAMMTVPYMTMSQ